MKQYSVFVIVLSNEDIYIIIDMSYLHKEALLEVINGITDDCYLTIDKYHAESIASIKTSQHAWELQLKKSSNKLKSRTARNQNKMISIFSWFK